MYPKDKDVIQMIFSIPSELISSTNITTLVVKYLKFLLFHRSQIPQPVELLQRSKSSINKTFKQKTYSKKCEVLLKSLQQIEEILMKIIQKNEEFKIAILFGASLFHIDEIFTIEQTCSTIKIGSTTNDQSKSMNHLSKKFCFNLMTSLSDLDEYRPTKTYVFINMKKPEHNTEVAPNPNFKFDNSKHKMHVDIKYDESLSIDLVNEKISKISLHSGKENELSVQEKINKTQTTSLDKKLDDKWENKKSFMWFQIPVTIKGFT